MSFFHVPLRDGVLGLRTQGLIFGVIALMVGGCLDIAPDPNYCANATGDFFCKHRYGSGGPSFCVDPSRTCLGAYADVIQGNPDFDGCVADRPEDDACYSPCGYGKTFVEENGCLEDATGTGGETGMTTMGAVSTGSTGETAGVDGATLGVDTTTGGATVSMSTSDSTSTTDSTSTGETGNECSMWGGTMNWGGCLTDLNFVNPVGVCNLVGAAMDEGATCILVGEDPDVTHSTCAVSCMNDDPCTCPEPPMSGTATVGCDDIDGENGDECYLDCAGDAVCPFGMECVDGQYCAAPTEPVPMYGDCIAGCALPGVCAVSEGGSHQVCVTPCFGLGSCSANPEPMTSTAMPACDGAIAPPGGEECHLGCAMSRVCPDGMDCIAPSVPQDIDSMTPDTYEYICMWPIQ